MERKTPPSTLHDPHPMLHAELIAGLEALTAWSGVRVFVGHARQKVGFPRAGVLEKSMPQFGSTRGKHPIHTHSGFSVLVYGETQLATKTLAIAAYDWLRDITGKLLVTGERWIEAADAPDSPQDGLVDPEDGSDAPIFMASFDVHFIHRAV